MFCIVERFVFCADMQDFKLLLQKFEVNFENDELKTTNLPPRVNLSQIKKCCSNLCNDLDLSAHGTALITLRLLLVHFAILIQSFLWSGIKILVISMNKARASSHQHESILLQCSQQPDHSDL